MAGKHSFEQVVLIACIGLAACSGRVIGPAAAGSEDIFRPPVAPATATSVHPPQPSPSPVPTRSMEVSQPTGTPACSDGLSFLEDLSIPDGSVAAPGQELDKRWQVENTGSCNWDERYRLRLIAGSSLSAQPEQGLYPARSGTKAVIRILFTAPSDPGAYRSAWQAYNPQGEPFGDPFFIDINVAGP